MDYGSHSVTIHTTDTSSIVKLGGITAMGMPLNTERSGDESGQVYNKFAAINFQAPRPHFTTKSIAAAIAAITQKGICINVDETHPGVKIYGEAKGDCASAAPGSGDHLEYLIDGGLIYPLTLSASGRIDAALSVAIDAISDGTNAPFGADYSATLPTGLDESQFVLGAMRIGNLVWSDVRSFNLDFGIQRVEAEPQLGGVWPYRAGTRKALPVATITARDPAQLDDSTGIPLLGKEATHANTILYFKKRLNRATFEADASTVHLKLTIAGLVHFDNPFEVSGQGSAETSLTVVGVHDGTNFPLIFTPNVAYDPTP